jgi:hypothetical protein
MEEQWNVVYVDRISGRELTSRTLDSREAAFPHASDLNRNHDEVLRITGPWSIAQASSNGSRRTQCEGNTRHTGESLQLAAEAAK